MRFKHTKVKFSCFFTAIQRDGRRTNEGDFERLRIARVPDITVSVQEEYKEAVGGGWPPLVFFTSRNRNDTACLYNRYIFHSHHW